MGKRRSIFDLTNEHVGRLQLLSQAFAKSSFSRASSEDIWVVMLKGMEVGLDPLAAMDLINIIQNKPTLSPQGMLALISETDELDDIQIVGDEKQCTVTMQRRGRTPHRETFTLQEATAMGLANKSNWKSQPKVMLKWRAISACSRVVFPDIIQGMYTPEELNPDGDYDADGALKLSAPDQTPSLPPPVSKPAPEPDPERRIATFVKVRHAVEADGKPLRFVADSGAVYDVFDTSLLKAAGWDVRRWQTGDRSLVKDGFEIEIEGMTFGSDGTRLTLTKVKTQAPPPDPDEAARAVHDKTKERRMETGLNTPEEREAAKSAKSAEEKSSIAPADVTVENLFAFAMQELILDADATIKWMNGNAMSDSQTVASDWLDMAHGGNLQAAIAAIQSAN